MTCLALLICPTISAQEITSKKVVFITADSLSPDLVTSLEGALRAHFSDVEGSFSFKKARMSSFSLREIIEKSRAFITTGETIAVFLLDADSPNDWLLYLVDAKTEQVIARRITFRDSSESVGAETVAIITSNATSALLAGEQVSPRILEPPPSARGNRRAGDQALAMVPVPEQETSASRPIDKKQKSSAKSPKPPAVVVPKPSPQVDTATKKAEEVRSPSRSEEKIESEKVETSPKPESDTNKPGLLEQILGGRVRVALAYRGSTYAKQRTLQHGLSLWGAWVFNRGLYAGAGYLIVPATDIPTSEASYGSVAVKKNTMSVQRHPIEIFLGHSYRKGRFCAFGELVGLFDILTVNYLSNVDSTFIKIGENKERLSFGLAARGALEYTLIGGLAGFVGFGIEDYLGNFAYTYKKDNGLPNAPSDKLLSPIQIRALLQLGLSFTL
jgi:hypothetical protein